MQDIAEDYRKGNSGINYPSNITTEKSRAFYGTISESLKNVVNVSNEELGELTLKIQDEIENKIKVDYKQSEEVINKMKQSIDELLFFYLSGKGVQVDFEKIDKLIDEILEITISNY